MNSVSVDIRVEQCVISVNLEPFFRGTMTNTRKLFKLAASEYERNKGSIEIIGDFISERILFAEAGIKTALHEYRNGYVDTKYQTCNVDVAERNNRRLLTAVKTAQSQHKKYLAIQKAYYDAIK